MALVVQTLDTPPDKIRAALADGAGRLAQNPIGQAILRARNRECLARLEDLSHRY